MKTTTEYIQRTIIDTDDDGTVTIRRTYRADTLTEFLFSELTPEAQNRAIRDAIEEEDDPENWYSSQTYFSESEIWECAEDLTKQQPIRIYQDYGCSYQGEARAHRWGAAWEEVTEAEHNGIGYSMDMCDKWNEYAPRIIALQEAHEEATALAEQFWSIASDAQWQQYDPATEAGSAEYWHLETVGKAAVEAAADVEAIRDRIEDAAEELTEDAAHAVGNVVDGLIEAEHDYYRSEDFWSYWLQDADQYRFTREGERI